MTKVTYEGITFNANWAGSKTEKEFIEHEKHHGLTDTQLKEVHKLCKEAVKPADLKAAPATT
jgi:hypothetical protein